jgi:hypothetical protein
VEGCEGHDVAIGWRQRFLATRHEPLYHLGSRTKKTTLDEAFHARVVMLERYHDSMGSKGEGTRTSPMVEE